MTSGESEGTRNSRNSRIAITALGFAAALFVSTPLTPLILTQRTNAVMGNLTSGGDSATTGGHPWMTVPLAALQPFLLVLALLSAAALVANIVGACQRTAPPLVSAAGILLALVALLVWSTTWDHSFAALELLRDLGVEEP